MRTATTFEGELLELIDAPLVHAGYYIVQLKLTEERRKKNLALTVERTDQVPMSVKDCEVVSNTVSALLDVADPIEGAYDLEVSSPGLERPLTSLADFDAYKGYEVSIGLAMAQQGRKRFKGKIIDVSGDQITIEREEQQFTLAYPGMKTAHLIATEEMIRHLLKESDEKQRSKV